MKKGIILNFKPNKLFDYITQNRVFILLCALFISGIIIGSTTLDNSDFLAQNTNDFFDNFIKTHTTYKFATKFFTCFVRYAFILILYFLSGASLIGVAITPFITIWQGIAVGCITSHLYATYKLGGIAFNAIVYIPPSIIFVMCCFFAAKYAIDFSLGIAKLTLPKTRPYTLYNLFKLYSIRFLIFIGISLISTLLEITLNLLFLKFFNI